MTPQPSNSGDGNAEHAPAKFIVLMTACIEPKPGVRGAAEAIRLEHSLGGLQGRAQVLAVLVLGPMTAETNLSRISLAAASAALVGLL